MTELARNHAKFLSHLDESESTRWRIARWLNERGYVVSIPPLKRAATRADWKDAADDGDLHVVHRVEVKQLSREFTCREDWPFGDQFIVCARHAFDLAKPKPYAFIIVSKSGSTAAIVLSTNSRDWRIAVRTDSRYEAVSQEFYFAPMAQVDFVRIR